jgi:thiol-disulfide isomerase/thioredoxin
MSGTTSPKVIDKVDTKSLNTIIKDISEHGCILLYHWNDCGYCKRFMPTWQELKDTYGNVKQFYEIELSTIRQAPETFKSITGFPTIVVYTGDGSAKIRYEQERDFNTVAKFIQLNVPDYDKPKSPSPPKSKSPSPPKSKSPSPPKSKSPSKPKSKK